MAEQVAKRRKLCDWLAETQQQKAAVAVSTPQESIDHGVQGFADLVMSGTLPSILPQQQVSTLPQQVLADTPQQQVLAGTPQQQALAGTPQQQVLAGTPQQLYSAHRHSAEASACQYFTAVHIIL